MANNTTLLLTSTATNTQNHKDPSPLVTSKRQRIQTSYWLNTGKQLFASGLSGCCEVCCTYPTDFCKIILQLDERSGKERRYKNSLDVVKKTIRSYGILGVYRGFSVVFYGAIPKYMFRFGSYEQIKRHFADKNGQLKPHGKLICGLGAGIVEALFAVIPQESIKVKFINDRFSDKPRYRGLLHGISEIVKEKGLRGLYQGVLPTLLKQGSNQAIRFFVFDSLKEWTNNNNNSNLKNNKNMTKDNINNPNNNLQNKALTPLFGAIAGATSVLGNTPLDVVKTRMQSLEAHKYRSTLDCCKKIYRNEGLLAFYKGLSPRLVKVSLEVAIAFTMYNTFIDLFSIKLG